MNPSIVPICDKISKNEDMSREEMNVLKGYIFKANKCKAWNKDDVFGSFVLDVRENYNPDLTYEEKESWVYCHIKYAILVQAKFDKKWLLYSPVPVSLSWYEKEGGTNPAAEYQITDEEEEIEYIYKLLHWDFERAIYEQCILWWTPVKYVAKEFGKSSERGRVVKERISARIKEFIDYRNK